MHSFLLQDNEYVEFLIKGKKQTSITVVVVVGYTDDIFHFGQAPYSDINNFNVIS